MNNTYSNFVKDLVNLCRKHRVTLHAFDGIKVYESGYYPDVDNPYLPIIEKIKFDPDEGVNGRAWVEFIERAGNNGHS